MSGSVVASVASFTMAQVAPAVNAGVAGSPSSPGVENPESGGAGSVRWQRARLVLDQHQRGVDAGPAGQVLPVHAGLAQLLPYRGLRRGSTVVVRGSTTVLLALLAEATAEGSWAAVVGMPDLGLLAAAELGVAVSRLALVPRPGAEFGAVVAALLDGLDLVAVGAPGNLTTKERASAGGAFTGSEFTGSEFTARTATDGVVGTRANRRSGQPALATLARRLSARARHRESVLVSFGSWPGADLELDCAESSWSGLGAGHGHLVERELTVTVRGRGVASRPVSGRVLLPAGPGSRPGPGRTRFGTPTVIGSSGPSRLAGPARQTGVPEPTGSSGEPGSARLAAVPDPSNSPTGPDGPSEGGQREEQHRVANSEENVRRDPHDRDPDTVAAG